MTKNDETVAEDHDMGWGHFGDCPIAVYGDQLHGECSCDEMEIRIVSDAR